MLERAAVIPIVHVADLERARAFYAQVLGLREEGRTEGGNLIFSTGENGGHLELMVKPEAVQTDATVLTFEVEDVEQEVQELSARGARFLDVDLPAMKMVGKVAVLGRERAAWLRDSEGNVLCVHDRSGKGQESRAAP